MQLGIKVRKLREEAGYSQSELAEKVGVTQGFISHIELGIREPGLPTLRKIAAVLGVPVEYLVKDDQPKAANE